MVSRNKKFVLGIDIGGRGIKAELYEVINGKLSPKPVYEKTEPPRKGLAEHVAQINQAILFADEYAQTHLGGTVIAAGLGSPGRFDANGVIKPGTNTQMGKAPNEFDGANLQQRYEKSLVNTSSEGLPLFLWNDGNAMLAGMLEAINTKPDYVLHDQNGCEITKHSLRRKQVALFGLGSGVGHAIVKMKDDGTYDFVTDGHASKLRLKIDQEDMPALIAANEIILKGPEPEMAAIFMEDDKSVVRAEDPFKGPMVNALAEHFGNGDRKKGMSEALKFGGKYMARTVALIHSGENKDTKPENGWSEEDKKTAAYTHMYLIGGGLGRSDDGAELIKNAAWELQKMGIHDVQLVQVPDKNAAPRAAANLVPPAVLSPQEARARA